MAHNLEEALEAVKALDAALAGLAPGPESTRLRTLALNAMSHLQVATHTRQLDAALAERQRLVQEQQGRMEREVAQAQAKQAEASAKAAQALVDALTQELEVALRSSKAELEARYQERVHSAKAQLVSQAPPAPPANPEDALASAIYAREQTVFTYLEQALRRELELAQQRLDLVRKRAV